MLAKLETPDCDVKDDALQKTATPEQIQKLRLGITIFKEDTYISDYTQILDGETQYSLLYFLLLESIFKKPFDDPSVMRLNGGPDCSSMLGAYTELSRYNYAYHAIGNSTDDNYKMIYNKYTWNNNANEKKRKKVKIKKVYKVGAVRLARGWKVCEGPFCLLKKQTIS